MSFKFIEKLGEGNFGTVFKLENENGLEVAYKVLDAKKIKYIEIDILNRLYSPYIIRLLEPKFLKDNYGQGLIRQLKEDNLENLDSKKLPYIQIKRLIISAIYGLRCMHRKGFLHLDISPSNILYDRDNEENYTAYLSDFGWSVKCDNAYEGIISNKVIKYSLVPLEPLDSEEYDYGYGKEGRKYSDKSDIWSMGIVILNLLGTKITNNDKINLINDSFIEEKIRLYNNEKMNNYEEIKLKELLINMLNTNTKERVSSKDITKLSFFSSTNRLLNFSEECILNKPTEMVFIPYINQYIFKGLKDIKNYYYVNSEQYECIKIEEYFLAIQIYLRLMSNSPPTTTEDELIVITKEAIEAAINYYDRKSDNGDYDLVKKLNFDIGYNFYYYAHYLEDLLILNYYITENNNDLIGFYNLLNIDKLFEKFREVYEYKGLKRNSVSLRKFLDMEIPNKKDNTEIDFLTNLDYHEIIIENQDSSNSLVRKYKDIEKEFRTDIIQKYENKIIYDYVNNDIDIISKVEKMIEVKNYTKLSKDLIPNFNSKDIIKELQNLNDCFVYEKIDIDIYGNIDIKKDSLKDDKIVYYIVYYKNKYSLLVKESETMTHYYSEKIEYLEEYLKNYNFKYKNNFNYGINTCCKIIEICLLFIIYYNLKTGKKDYHFKCLDYHTIKSIILVLSL